VPDNRRPPWPLCRAARTTLRRPLSKSRTPTPPTASCRPLPGPRPPRPSVLFWPFARFDDIWAGRAGSLRPPSSAQGLTFYRDEIATPALRPPCDARPAPHGHLRTPGSAKGSPRRRLPTWSIFIREFASDRSPSWSGGWADGEPGRPATGTLRPSRTSWSRTCFGVPQPDRVPVSTRGCAPLTLPADKRVPGGPANAIESVARCSATSFSEIAPRGAPNRGDGPVRADRGRGGGERLQTDWDKFLGFSSPWCRRQRPHRQPDLARGVALLYAHHDQRERLVADPRLIPNRLLEFVPAGRARAFIGPTTLPRHRARTTDPGGREGLLMLFGAANPLRAEFGPGRRPAGTSPGGSPAPGLSIGVTLSASGHTLARLQSWSPSRSLRPPAGRRGGPVEATRLPLAPFTHLLLFDPSCRPILYALSVSWSSLRGRCLG